MDCLESLGRIPALIKVLSECTMYSTLSPWWASTASRVSGRLADWRRLIVVSCARQPYWSVSQSSGQTSSEGSNSLVDIFQMYGIPRVVIAENKNFVGALRLEREVCLLAYSRAQQAGKTSSSHRLHPRSQHHLRSQGFSSTLIFSKPKT